MGDDQQGRAGIALALEEEIEDRRPRRGVEIAGRLVGEEQGRARRGRPGDGDPLLLAARQLRRIMGEPVAEADRLELRPGEVERPLAAGQLQRNGDIFERGHRRKQMEGLEDDPDPPLPGPGEIVLAQGGEVRSGDPDGPAGRPLKPRQHRHQRGFSAPRGPEQGNAFAARDL